MFLATLVEFHACEIRNMIVVLKMFSPLEGSVNLSHFYFTSVERASRSFKVASLCLSLEILFDNCIRLLTR